MRQSLINKVVDAISVERYAVHAAEAAVDALVEWLRDNEDEIVGTSIVDLAGILERVSR